MVKRGEKLTSLHAHKRHSTISPRIPSSGTPNFIIPIRKNVRHDTIIRHSKMVNTRRKHGARNIILVRDLRPFDLVPNALARGEVAVHVQVVKESGQHVVRKVCARVGELFGEELGGATVEGNVAVDAWVGAARGCAVESHVEGKVEFAVVVVVGLVGWAAEVAGGGAGEDEVFGVGSPVACC